MRIAYFTDTTYPHPNGVATHVHEVSILLAKRGHKIGIFSPKVRGQKDRKNLKHITLPGITIPKRFFKVEASVGIPLHPKILQLAKGFDPDIIHVQTPYPVGISGRKVAKKLDKPLVETFHGYIMDAGYLKVVGLSWTRELIEPFIWKLVASSLNKSDLVISPSDKAAEDIKSHGVYKKIVVVPNGIRFNTITKAMSRTKVFDFVFADKRPVVIYVGRLSWEKNLDILIKSFQLVAEKIPTAGLLLVGDGPARKSLEKLVLNLGIKDKSTFTGFIERQKLLESGILENSKLFATTSKSENQPLSIIEALAFGLPVVAVKSRGLTELVKDCGILCEPDDIKGIADSIVKILKDESLRKRLSMKSKTKSRLYDVENTARLFEKYYKILINEKKKD